MRSRAMRTGAALVLILTASAAAAQAPPPTQPPTQAPHWGIVLGYPVTFAVVWQPNDRLAFRPDINVGYSETGVNNFTHTSTHQWRLGTGISTLIYLRTTSPFRVYVSPRYGYRRLSQSTEQMKSATTSSGGRLSTTTQTPDTTVYHHEHALGGLAGAEIRVNNDFCFFGEGGVEYRRLHWSSEGTPPRISTGTTSGDVGGVGSIGITVYF
jgi:hypothetical protein